MAKWESDGWELVSQKPGRLQTGTQLPAPQKEGNTLGLVGDRGRSGRLRTCVDHHLRRHRRAQRSSRLVFKRRAIGAVRDHERDDTRGDDDT